MVRVFGNVPGRSDTERRMVSLIVTIIFSSCVRNKLLTTGRLILLVFVSQLRANLLVQSFSSKNSQRKVFFRNQISYLVH